MLKQIFFDLDLSVKNINLGPIKQNNSNSIQFVANIVDDGKPFNISGASYAMISIQLPDNTVSNSVCQIQGQKVSYTLEPNAVTQIGVYQAEIQLFGAGDVMLVSSTFYYYIVDSLFDDTGVTSQPEWPILIQMISDVTELNDTMVAAEALREANEATRLSEEDARQANETIRQSNETSRIETFSANESSRQSVFNSNEANRQATFVNSEQMRNLTTEQNIQAQFLRMESLLTAIQYEASYNVMDFGHFRDYDNNAPSIDCGEFTDVHDGILYDCGEFIPDYEKVRADIHIDTGSF